MFKFLAHKFRLPTALLGALGGTTLALMAFTAQADAASLQMQLQQVADNAALAGVNTLGNSAARTEAEKREEAIKATKKVIAEIPGVDGQITASVQDMTMTVKLAATETLPAYFGANVKTLAVTSSARYVAPEQPTNWAWASKQHFAVGQTPVVVGSACVQNCGADRLR
jgi:hypothetical protein